MKIIRQEVLPRVKPGLLAVFILVSTIVVSWLPNITCVTRFQAWADDSSKVAVVLAEVSVTDVAGSKKIDIRGTVSNTSESVLEGVQVQFWRSRYRFTTPADISSVINSPADKPLGRRMTSVNAGQVWFPPEQILIPNQSVSFQVSSNVEGADSLGLTEQPSAYLVGVHVRANLQGRDKTVGSARSLVTLTNPDFPSARADLVLLSIKPELSSDPLQLCAELNGRLKELVDYAIESKSGVVIDPGLYQDVIRLTETGDEQQTKTAVNWLKKVDQLFNQNEVYRSQHGLANLAQAVTTRSLEVLDYATVLPESSSPYRSLAGLPLVLVTGDEKLTETTAAYLARLKPAAILSNRLKQGSFSYRGTSVIGLLDLTLLAGPGPSPKTTLTQKTGTLQALRLTHKLSGFPPPVVLASSSEDVKILNQAVSTVEQVTLAKVCQEDSHLNPRWDLESSSSWSNNWLDSYRQARSSFDVVHELTGTNQLTIPEMGLLARFWSLSWVCEFESQSWLANQLEDTNANSVGAAISLKVSDKFSIGSSQADLPITVTNHLAEPASFRLVFESDYPGWISVSNTDVLTVAPGDSETVVARASARTNASVRIVVWVETVNGHLIDEPKQFIVESTSFGNLGWLLIFGAGATILSGAALRIRKVRKLSGRLADTVSVSSLSKMSLEELDAAASRFNLEHSKLTSTNKPGKQGKLVGEQQSSEDDSTKDP